MNGLSAFCPTDARLPSRHNTWRLDSKLEAPAICEPLPHNARHGPPPTRRDAQRLAVDHYGEPCLSKSCAVESNRAEFGVNSKDEIKRLVELLLTTDDLRAVQSLTVEVQRAMYLHIEELQRRLMVPRIEGPNDGSVVEIDGSNPSSGLSLPKPGERP